MSDTLLIYFEDIPWTQETETADVPFSTSLYGKLLDADVGYAVTSDERSIQQAHAESVEAALGDADFPTKFSSGYRREYCITDPNKLTTQVNLFSGETVDVDEYDTILVTFVLSQLYYIRYLRRIFPEKTIIGIQDESLQDVQLFPPDLQMLHYSALKDLDGFISEDPVYARWVAGIVEEVLKLPLLVPNGHFDDVPANAPSEGRVCIGIGSNNLDPANIYTNIAVHQNLRDRGYELDAEFLGAVDFQQEKLAAYEMSLSNVAVLEYMDTGYYEHLAGYDLAILLTERVSAGRVSAELAAVGVPCIGNAKNDLQQRCFPELSIEPHDVPTAVELATRLLTETDYRERILAEAKEEVTALQNHDQAERELESFVERIRTQG